MATKLTKPVIRETKIDGEDYIVTLDMLIGVCEPLVTLRKKGSRGAPLKFFFKDLLEEKPETPNTDMISYKEVMSRLETRLHMAEPLREIVRDIFEVNVLASDLSDEEVTRKGVALPE